MALPTDGSYRPAPHARRQTACNFLACVHDAERAAYTRPEPCGADEDGWMTTAQTVMTKLRTADRGVATAL